MLFTGNKTAFIYDDSSIEVLSPKTGKVKVLQRGSYFGRYSLEGSSFIFTIRRYSECFSNLYHLETRGTPVPLLEDVAGNTATAGGQFDFSRGGTFIYSSGKSSSGTWTLIWINKGGPTQPLLAAQNRVRRT